MCADGAGAVPKKQYGRRVLRNNSGAGNYSLNGVKAKNEIIVQDIYYIHAQAALVLRFYSFGDAGGSDAGSCGYRCDTAAYFADGTA